MFLFWTRLTSVQGKFCECCQQNIFQHLISVPDDVHQIDLTSISKYLNLYYERSYDILWHYGFSLDLLVQTIFKVKWHV